MTLELEQLLREISDFCRSKAIAESTLGRMVANDGKLVARLRDGKSITLKTLRKLEDYMSTNGGPSLSAVSPDYVAGGAATVLALHDYQRLDSLVPSLRALGRGGIIRRAGHPPLIFDGDVLTWPKLTPPPSQPEFWSILMPGLLIELGRNGTLKVFAEPGPAQRRQTLTSRSTRSALPNTLR